MIMSTDDTNIPASADQQEDEASVVTEDDNTTSKSDEPSVHCLAADLLSTWHSLKVCISLHLLCLSVNGVNLADITFLLLCLCVCLSVRKWLTTSWHYCSSMVKATDFKFDKHVPREKLDMFPSKVSKNWS